MKNDHNGTCIALTHVDDNLVVGAKKALDQLLIDLKDTEFTFTAEHDLTDCLSCEIIRDGKHAWLGQPHMMKRLQTKFGEITSKLPRHRTVGVKS